MVTISSNQNQLSTERHVSVAWRDRNLSTHGEAFASSVQMECVHSLVTQTNCFISGAQPLLATINKQPVRHSLEPFPCTLTRDSEQQSYLLQQQHNFPETTFLGVSSLSPSEASGVNNCSGNNESGEGQLSQQPLKIDIKQVAVSKPLDQKNTLALMEKSEADYHEFVSRANEKQNIRDKALGSGLDLMFMNDMVEEENATNDFGLLFQLCYAKRLKITDIRVD
ncbi:unnamed protein product [Protopolystoma xenopodis]|uniref:Uncharacterized protein n=1 Tax=Protopolystoma xenopodis TaxID=117903 RepID=A0A448X2R7_9PLAT|nr:unnamed protein product [Protopolystoma xenopodis]